jgi:hypothetical protein
MNPELLAFLIKKARIPHMTKSGIMLSVLTFQLFDINHRVKKKLGL